MTCQSVIRLIRGETVYYYHTLWDYGSYPSQFSLSAVVWLENESVRDHLKSRRRTCGQKSTPVSYNDAKGTLSCLLFYLCTWTLSRIKTNCRRCGSQTLSSRMSDHDRRFKRYKLLNYLKSFKTYRLRSLCIWWHFRLLSLSLFSVILLQVLSILMTKSKIWNSYKSFSMFSQYK